MNRRESVNRAAVARWRRRALGREIVDQFMEQLRKATEDRLPPEEDFDAVPDAPPPADTAPAPPPTKAHKERRKTKARTPRKRTTLEEDWRRDARAAGLTARQVEESWVWYYRYAVEAPPVLEEHEQRKARVTMPNAVRRVLTRHPFYRFVGYDAEVLDDLEPIPDDVRTDADARQFWEDVRDAQKNDTPKSAARLALGRFGRSIKLNSELMGRLADMHGKDGTTVAAEKRRLIQEAVVLSLDAAKKPIRIGEQKTKSDAGHPITLEDIFGPEGLRDILPYVRRDRPEDARREILKDSLGGPFRPAHLADRAVYRNWLTKEIRLRTVKLLEEDLDLRIGGGRREDISYTEATEPLDEMWYGEVGPDTQVFADKQMRATGEREERERGTRPRGRFMRQHDAWEKKNRIEDAILNSIDAQRKLERAREENENAPQRLQYLDCIRREPRLFSDNRGAAEELGWDEKTVRQTKQLLRKAEKGRWKPPFPKRL